MDTGFCVFIDTYCEVLGSFILDVKNSTNHSVELIRGVKKRSKGFDAYVISIEDFNKVISDVINFVKDIIKSLMYLFLRHGEHYNEDTGALVTSTRDAEQKNTAVQHIYAFFTAMNNFMLYMVKSRPLDKLNSIKSAFDSKYQKNARMIEKIEKIHLLIRDVFNVTITITAIFIPQISAIALPIANEIDRIFVAQMEERKTMLREQAGSMDIDEIIRKLADIQIQSEIFKSIDVDTIYDCLLDKNAAQLVVEIERLRIDCSKICALLSAVTIEIEKYKKRGRPFF